MSISERLRNLAVANYDEVIDDFSVASEGADEIYRLRKLVYDAFWEGFQSGRDGGWIGQGQGHPWKVSDAYAELEKSKDDV
jgi:hypothetical protein